MESRPGQYLTFRIARQEFAISAACIRGLLPLHEVILLDAPKDWVIATGSIRGHEFPVVDVRGKLRIPRGSPGRQPCVIVVEAAAPPTSMPRNVLVGFVADRISEVVTLRERDFRQGKVRAAGRLRRVLDPDKILDYEPAKQKTLNVNSSVRRKPARSVSVPRE